MRRVAIVLRQSTRGGKRPQPWHTRQPAHQGLAEREEVARGIQTGALALAITTGGMTTRLSTELRLPR